MRQPVRTTARPRTLTSRIEVSVSPLTDSEITISRSRTLAIAALILGAIPAISAIASVLLLEIVISLSVSGLSDTSMRDVGVLGLAVVLTGCRNQRLVLRN